MGKELAVKKEQVEQAIEMVAKGKSLVAVANDLNLKLTTLWTAIQSDPLSAEAFERARELRAEVEVDELIEIADTSTKEPKVVRNQLDARKWRITKLKPKKYGDRLQLDVTTTTDIAGALGEAKSRVRPLRDQSNVIDAVIVRESTRCDDRSSDKESLEPQKFEDLL